MPADLLWATEGAQKVRGVDAGAAGSRSEGDEIFSALDA